MTELLFVWESSPVENQTTRKNVHLLPPTKTQKSTQGRMAPTSKKHNILSQHLSTMSRIVTMPKLLLVILFYTISTICRAQEGTIPSEPPFTKWYMEKPNFWADRVDLYLEYPVSDFIPFANLDWILYDSLECGSGDITDNDYLNAVIDYDENLPNGDGTGWKLATLSLTFDPDTIRGSPIMTTVGREQRLQFCIRMGAYSSQTNIPGAMEIFYKETSIDVLITDEGGVDLDDSTGVSDGANGGGQLYTLRGYLCDQDDEEIIDPSPIFQGMPTKVCVTPVEQALQDNVYMHAIDSFYWTRETTYQAAITPKQEAAPLTIIDCEPGRVVCSFVTLLKADFFYKLGRAYGTGFGWLQFGTGGNEGDSRRMKAAIEFDFEENILQYNSIGPTARQAGGTDYPNYAGSGPFQVDIPVTRLYRAYGWLCDKDNVELDARANPIAKGDVARVCVTPDDIAINQDDVRIRAIDSFTWYRYDIEHNQTAITSNSEAAPETEIFCRQGSTVCAFETLLDDAFYESIGAVTGNGIVWLQFGDDSRRQMAVDLQLGGRGNGQGKRQGQISNRSLQFGLEDFQLGASFLPYMEPGFAGASPFDVVVYLLLPLEERPLYKCRAFECKPNNAEFVDFEPKEEGDVVRMCVIPTTPAVAEGIKMWSVEWWQWSQTEQRTQDAIVEQGEEAEDGRTVSFCYRGMDICSFTTRLRPIFFSAPQPNYLFGNGECWLTYPDGTKFQAPIEFVGEGESSGTEIDPTADPLYAGHNDIGISFPTNGNYTEDPNECPPEDHTLEGWWEQEDDQLKAIYITAVVTTCAGICCLWLMCLFCNRREGDESDVNNNLILNLDIAETKETKTNLERNEEHHQEHNMNGESVATETTHDEGESFHGNPTENDVCFGMEDHPGTIRFRKIVRTYIKKDIDAAYGPKSFRNVKRRMGDCFFVEKESPKGAWVPINKSRLVSKVGVVWIEEKKKLKAKEGEFTTKDLKEKRKEDKKKKQRRQSASGPDDSKSKPPSSKINAAKNDRSDGPRKSRSNDDEDNVKTRNKETKSDKRDSEKKEKTKRRKEFERRGSMSKKTKTQRRESQ